MNALKIVLISILFIANASFAQPPQATSTPSVNHFPNMQRLEDLPRSSYSPKTIEYRGSDIPEGEILGILFSNPLLFRMTLHEEDYEKFKIQKATLNSSSGSEIANESICLLALLIDENDPSIYQAEELAERINKRESDNSKKIISAYSELIQASSDFAFQVYENYRAYIQARAITKKIDYDYEAVNNTGPFIQNQKIICSNN